MDDRTRVNYEARARIIKALAHPSRLHSNPGKEIGSIVTDCDQKHPQQGLWVGTLLKKFHDHFRDLYKQLIVDNGCHGQTLSFTRKRESILFFSRLSENEWGNREIFPFCMKNTLISNRKPFLLYQGRERFPKA